MSSPALNATEYAAYPVPFGITLLFAGVLLALILSLALEEKLHAKKSLIVGLFAAVSLLVASVLGGDYSVTGWVG